MRLQGSIRATETTEITSSGRFKAEAYEALAAQVPPGHVLVRAADRKVGEGIEMTGAYRTAAVQPIEADGPDYASAYAALRAQVPEGYVLLGVAVVA